MNTATFTTSRDALDSIRQALGEHANGHDLRAILEEAFDYDSERQAFVQTADVDEFWAIVEQSRRNDEPTTQGSSYLRLAMDDQPSQPAVGLDDQPTSPAHPVRPMEGLV